MTNELGLHFRAAAMVVRTLSKFSSKVTMSNGRGVADARSVLDLMTLAASHGTVVPNGPTVVFFIRLAPEVVREFDN